LLRTVTTLLRTITALLRTVTALLRTTLQQTVAVTLLPNTVYEIMAVTFSTA
jgi:hypothetical protein